MQKQIGTVFCTDLERDGSLLWCVVLNISGNKRRKKKDRAVLACGFWKWLNRASLCQCMRCLQSLLLQVNICEHNNKIISEWWYLHEEKKKSQWLLYSLTASVWQLPHLENVFHFTYFYMAVTEAIARWWRVQRHSRGGRQLVYWADS